MEFKTKNYVYWQDYLAEHPNLTDIPAAQRVQDYEDQIFALVLRCFR